MTVVSRSQADIEKAVQAKLGATPLALEQMAAVSAIHRAAAALRQHLENSALRRHDLTWTAFVVLWFVWLGGEMETRDVAGQAGISKGTLTGVANTLQSRGLLERRGHPADGRLVVLRLTPDGDELMGELFPGFHDEQVFVTEPLQTAEAHSLADMLGRVVTHLKDNGEQRRLELRKDQPVPPRRGGRRAKQK